jgi:toxin ParE1/3/4
LREILREIEFIEAVKEGLAEIDRGQGISVESVDQIDGSMDYTVILSPRAVADLEAIIRYIALENPTAAGKVGQNLLNKTKELSQFPFKGQKVPEFNNSDIRQVILKPYRIVYRVEENKKRISVARFWHSFQENLELRRLKI